LQDAPENINKIIAKGPDSISKIISTGQKLVTSLSDITKDPSALQSTIDDVRREAKNILKSTPEGLETPSYEVVKKTPVYEIRTYAPYSVAQTQLQQSADQSSMSVVAVAQGFNTLADYIFGNNYEPNSESVPEKLSMTTPVIIGGGMMEFVLPSGKTASSAPTPSDAAVVIKDLPKETVAALEFPGIATDGETLRQRAVLEGCMLNIYIFT